MQVQLVMTPSPCTCGPDANLCEAIEQMWKGDFGMLPVTDVDGHVTGVLTDRDIAIALGTRNNRASSVRVGDVMSRAVRTCRRDDEIAGALETMRKVRVRRLPVVDAENRLCGLLSLNDAVLETTSGVPPEEVLATYHAICEHRKPSVSPLVTAA